MNEFIQNMHTLSSFDPLMQNLHSCTGIYFYN